MLRAATNRAAAALGTDRIGVLEASRAADPLIVDGDLLRDMRVLHEVMGVLAEGHMVFGDITAQQLPTTERSPTQRGSSHLRV